MYLSIHKFTYEMKVKISFRLLNSAVMVLIVILIALSTACRKTMDNPVTKQDEVYRGPATEEVVLHRQDVEMIAQYVNQRDKTTELLYAVVGFLLVLLLGGLLFVLRWLVITNRDTISALRTDMSALQQSLAIIIKGNEDGQVLCQQRHQELERRIKNVEE